MKINKQYVNMAVTENVSKVGSRVTYTIPEQSYVYMSLYLTIPKVVNELTEKIRKVYKGDNKRLIMIAELRGKDNKVYSFCNEQLVSSWDVPLALMSAAEMIDRDIAPQLEDMVKFESIKVILRLKTYF